MTFFRIFSAVSPDIRSDFYDDTSSERLMIDAVAHLVNIGSEFAVWVYSDRQSFLNGADPYAVLTYEGGDCVRVSDTICGWSNRRTVCMHTIYSTPSIVADRVGARVRTLAKRYNSIY